MAGSYVPLSPIDPAQEVTLGQWLVGIAIVLALLVIGGSIAFRKWWLPRLAG